MSAIEFLGGIGIGAVLGWLIGRLEPRRRPFLQALIVSSACAVALLEVVWLVSWQAALVTLCGGITASIVHKLWRSELRER